MTKRLKNKIVKIRSERRARAFRRFRVLIFAVLFFVSLSSVYAATTLAEYRKKIQNAKGLADVLLSLKSESLPAAERAKSMRESLSQLRQMLPITETVEYQGTSVETNNGWFQSKIDEYEKDESKRVVIFTEISERLSAIEQKTDELEKASVSNRTKDEEKRKLGEILNREEYQKPKEEEKSFFRRILDAVAEWFKRKSPSPDIVPSAAGLDSLSFFLQILLYIVVLGAIGFLIYRFAPFLADRFNKREKRKKKEERVILGERIGADESSDNIFSEAERLAREGNLRGAIRKGYIALLCELSDRKVIGLSRHKTNRDYLRDVRKRRELYENMNGLTSNFERHWYGSDEAEEKDWEDFRNGYRKAVSSER
ncbi:MAG TPA: DUF4129 domain-containing protein [Pyrinomonadaceae bacterium]